ncbi:unnamed protein product [Pneumocystis jirovecii]|uniref:Uncharacterized protein n=1 Tax=Pneumocystis jirovecii TaxID=42068 RepID=L0PFE4_PNEJI|nr:unnamed protein product [Pneumocystis jirovecii]
MIPIGLARFLRKKYFQYEVAFALNMLTTTEKMIVILISIYVYFPEHLRQLTAKAAYYWYG